MDALQAVRYNLGLAKERPRTDRYTWEEKVEYWSLIWGTVVMIATGFMLWNPVATARFLPGQWIPAAQVVHGGEALLAILAVLVWHFYSVHLRQLQPGHVHRPDDRARDGARAPARARADQGRGPRTPAHDPVALAKRQKVFLPVAGVVAALLLAGIYWFVTFEQTAITTLPLSRPVRPSAGRTVLAVVRVAIPRTRCRPGRWQSTVLVVPCVRVGSAGEAAITAGCARFLASGGDASRPAPRGRSGV